MKIKIEDNGSYSLVGMNSDELNCLGNMISGCCICEKRIFYSVKKEIDNLIK